jgi:LEA14-like dessication related protein
MKYWLVVLALSLGGCSLLGRHMQPEITLTGLRMGPGDGLRQTLLVDLVITNPDASPLKLNAISYRVRVEGRELASGASREPIDIAAGASLPYTVPASINLLSGFGFVRDMLTKPKARINYEVDATLEPDGLFSVPITVRKSDSISLSPQ